MHAYVIGVFALVPGIADELSVLCKDAEIVARHVRLFEDEAGGLVAVLMAELQVLCR